MKSGPNIHQYDVYIMTNPRGTALYTGMTNSLERRVWQHKNHAIPGFTGRYNCEYFLYFEVFQDVNQTIARETPIKTRSRAKKEELITGMNPEWKDLAADWYGEAARP